MLKRLSLLNFRCFEDHEIPVRSRTIIVGQNNAGKSTVVEALRLVSLVTERAGGLHFKAPPSWADLPRRCRGLSPSLQSIEIRKESLFHRYGSPPGLIKAEFTSGTRIELSIGPEAAIYGTIYDEKGAVISSSQKLRSAGIPSISILPQISPLAESETILGREYVRANLATARSSIHFRNQLHYYSEIFPEFRKLAEQSWPGLKIQPLDSGRGMPALDNLNLIVRDGDFSAEVSWRGAWNADVAPNDVVLSPDGEFENYHSR